MMMQSYMSQAVFGVHSAAGHLLKCNLGSRLSEADLPRARLPETGPSYCQQSLCCPVSQHLSRLLTLQHILDRLNVLSTAPALG